MKYLTPTVQGLAGALTWPLIPLAFAAMGRPCLSCDVAFMICTGGTTCATMAFMRRDGVPPLPRSYVSPRPGLWLAAGYFLWAGGAVMLAELIFFNLWTSWGFKGSFFVRPGNLVVGYFGVVAAMHYWARMPTPARIGELFLPVRPFSWKLTPPTSCHQRRLVGFMLGLMGFCLLFMTWAGALLLLPALAFDMAGEADALENRTEDTRRQTQGFKIQDG